MRRGEAKRKTSTGAIGSKTKQHRNIRATTAKASSLAKGIENISTAGTDKACSNKGS